MATCANLQSSKGNFLGISSVDVEVMGEDLKGGGEGNTETRYVACLCTALSETVSQL